MLFIGASICIDSIVLSLRCWEFYTFIHFIFKRTFIIYLYNLFPQELNYLSTFKEKQYRFEIL